MAGGTSFVLRPSQLESLVAKPDAANTTKTTYTPAQVAGLSCGLALPLAIALVITLHLLREEKRRHASPKLMYKLPDGHDELALRAHPLSRSNLSLPSHMTAASPSRRTSVGTTSSAKPAHLQSFAERYGKRVEAVEMDLGLPRHELDGDVVGMNKLQVHELAEKRLSALA